MEEALAQQAAGAAGVVDSSAAFTSLSQELCGSDADELAVHKADVDAKATAALRTKAREAATQTPVATDLDGLADALGLGEGTSA